MGVWASRLPNRLGLLFITASSPLKSTPKRFWLTWCVFLVWLILEGWTRLDWEKERGRRAFLKLHNNYTLTPQFILSWWQSCQISPSKWPGGGCVPRAARGLLTKEVINYLCTEEHSRADTAGISCCSQGASPLHRFAPNIDGASKQWPCLCLGECLQWPWSSSHEDLLSWPLTGTCIVLCTSLTAAHPGSSQIVMVCPSGRQGRTEQSQAFLTQACFCSTTWLGCFWLFSPFSNEFGGGLQVWWLSANPRLGIPHGLS